MKGAISVRTIAASDLLEVVVESLALNDFRKAMTYYGYTGVLPNIYEKEWKMENMFMEC